MKACSRNKSHVKNIIHKNIGLITFNKRKNSGEEYSRCDYCEEERTKDDQAGVYALYDKKTSKIVRIGKSKSLSIRINKYFSIEGHRGKRHIPKSIKELGLDYVKDNWFWKILCYTATLDIDMVEQNFIYMYQPEHNHNHKKKPRNDYNQKQLELLEYETQNVVT